MTRGKTISAHVTETTVAKIDQLAKLENRSPSQLTGAVVELGGDLPHEAWAALFQVINGFVLTLFLIWVA